VNKDKAEPKTVQLPLRPSRIETPLGAKQTASETKDPRISPAISQLLFAFASAKDAGNWSVRKLAEFAGLSKSNVAKVEQQLVAQGVLIESEEGFRLNLGVFFQHGGGETGCHEALLDGQEEQGFIARERDHGRYEYIRINDHPNHFFFSRLYALISASISWGLSLSRPRRFAGAIKSASQLCRLLMHVAPVIFPTSVGS
jgi:biotin operon repressor